MHERPNEGTSSDSEAIIYEMWRCIPHSKMLDLNSIIFVKVGGGCQNTVTTTAKTDGKFT